jgi:GT2 family glycosyltransferase
MCRFGVVIVNFNGRGYLEECLASLQRSRCQPAATIVVDNASHDGSPDIVASQFPDVVLIRNSENAGFAGGSNIGLCWCLQSTLDAVILLNPDTVLDPSALEALVAGARRHPGALLGPRLLLYSDPTKTNNYGTVISWWRGRSARAFRKRPIAPGNDERVGVLSGCCILAPREVLLEVGLFDEDYFLYFEDADLAVRAALAGREMWIVPDSRVLHRESSATGGRTSPLAMYYFVRNRHRFVAKFRHGRAVWLAFLAYSTLDLCQRLTRALVAGRLPLAAAVIRGAVDGWRGRTGPAAGLGRV